MIKKKGKQFIFRCDANGQSGFGHFSRSLNLARSIRLLSPDSTINFAGDYNPFANSLLEKFDFMHQHVMDENLFDEKKILSIINPGEYLIVDSYLYNQNFIDVLTGQPFNVFFIDDFNCLDFSNADLVVNYGVNASEMVYKARNTALGTNYFPAKPELADVRESKIKSSDIEIKRILFFLSGIDRYSSAEDQLILLLDENFRDVEIKFISNNGRKVELINTSTNRLICEKPAFDVERHYQWADLVVSGGGMMKTESAYCCIPNLTLSITPDIYKETEIYEREQLTYSVGTVYDFNYGFVSDRIKMFVSDKNIGKLLFLNGRSKFKTHSAAILADKILNI